MLANHVMLGLAQCLGLVQHSMIAGERWRFPGVDGCEVSVFHFQAYADKGVLGAYSAPAPQLRLARQVQAAPAPCLGFRACTSIDESATRLGIGQTRKSSPCNKSNSTRSFLERFLLKDPLF